jgi:rare lipoprotein A
VDPSPELAPPAVTPSAPDQLIDRGLASWYGRRFHGRRTASGERYDMHDFTAAHKTLPFGTRVRVRSLQTGKEVVVRINDRGPYRHRRIIDLSQAAITALGVRHRGVTSVELLRE